LLIDRYLIREVTAPFALIAALLLGIFLTFSVSRYLAEAVDGLIPPMAIAQLTSLRGVIALEVLLPLAFYLATLLSLSRLHGDFEITALRASGISESRFLWPLLRLALLLCALIGLLSWLVRPWAYAEIYRIEHQAAAAMALDRIRAGQFYQANRRSDGLRESSRAVFITDLDRSRTERPPATAAGCHRDAAGRTDDAGRRRRAAAGPPGPDRARNGAWPLRSL
jgi:lipopolysaccharide export system permease protein